MNFPNDRKLVDKDGRILDQWLRPLEVLKPLLEYTPADFSTLQALIAAAQETPEDAEDPLELPVATPDFGADYAITWKTSIGAGRRAALSAFRSALLFSADLSGNSSQGFAVPTTHPNLRILIRGFSFSTNAQGRFALSEDGGTTPLACAFELFNHTSIFAATTGETAPNITPSGGSGGAAVFTVAIDIFNALGSSNKLAIMNAVLDSSGSAYTGSYIFTSTAPLNFASITTTAGTFDAGTVELWGMP